MAKLVAQKHPALHGISEEVSLEDIKSPKIQKVLKDMRKALDDYNVNGMHGVAIAAPQIGVPLRIFLVHSTKKEADDKEVIPDMVVINPVITKLSKKKHPVGEGCLSVDKLYGLVPRSTHTTIRGYDEQGKKFVRGAGGLLAQIFQHEIDHLDGILFVDRAERIWDKDDKEAQEHHEAE
jgi:peptide deformylase